MQASILVLSSVHSVTVFNVPVYTGEKTLLFSALECLFGDSLLIASVISNYYYSYMYNFFILLSTDLFFLSSVNLPEKMDIVQLKINPMLFTQ
jgi:hypothetical protein